MIVLHIDPQCQDCRRIIQELDELALSHRLVLHGLPDSPLAAIEPPAPAHCIVDDEECFRGHRAMETHLEELRDLRRRWTAFQSDVCYCDLDD